MAHRCISNGTPYNRICTEHSEACTFRFAEYSQGDTFDHVYQDVHYIVCCNKGAVRLRGNLFQEEVIYAGELLFLPRTAECHGEVLADSHAIIHTFSNTVCTPENCILSYLYKHNRQSASHAEYHCKLTTHQAVCTFMDSITHYLTDKVDTLQLWQMKHKELIHLLCVYYKPEELQSFFHPMIGEQVSFKSLVMTHYRKANRTEELAELCGYSLHSFRRTFKKEFGESVYKWLIQRRAELIKYRLSMPHIPFVDIIDEFNFSSPQQFSRFCKLNLGDAPSNLRQQCAD